MTDTLVCKQCGVLDESNYDQCPYGIELQDRGDGTLGHRVDDPSACGDPEHCCPWTSCGPVTVIGPWRAAMRLRHLDACELKEGFDGDGTVEYWECAAGCPVVLHP